MTITTDLKDFGKRELARTEQLLKAMREQGIKYMLYHPPVTNLYSWRVDRKANKALIRYHLNRIIEIKKEAMEGKYCTEYATHYLKYSLKSLARDALNYHRLRAFLGTEVGTGWPWDKPAFDSWHSMVRS